MNKFLYFMNQENPLILTNGLILVTIIFLLFGLYGFLNLMWKLFMSVLNEGKGNETIKN